MGQVKFLNHDPTGLNPRQFSSFDVLKYCSLCGGVVNTVYADKHIRQTHSHTMEENDVSRVAWCDPGSHAFKAGSPGSQSGTMRETGQDGIERTVEFDACPEHTFRERPQNGQEALPWTEPGKGGGQ